MYQLRRGSSRTHALSLLSIRLGLAALENIPLVEARKIVASNNFLPPLSHNTLLDFKNFPYFQSHTYASSSFVPKSYSSPYTL